MQPPCPSGGIEARAAEPPAIHGAAQEESELHPVAVQRAIDHNRVVELVLRDKQFVERRLQTANAAARSAIHSAAAHYYLGLTLSRPFDTHIPRTGH